MTKKRNGKKKAIRRQKKRNGEKKGTSLIFPLAANARLKI
jgi:hypothetical protein